MAIPALGRERFYGRDMRDAPLILGEVPKLTVAQAKPELGLRRFEVVAAKNLDMPYRYAQEFYWVEILASAPDEAVRAASEWVFDEADDEFEATDMVRVADVHPSELGRDHQGEPIRVAWNLPLPEDLPPGYVVRDPVTGVRAGFIAGAEADSRYLSEHERETYRMLVRKPVAQAAPVCVVPLVTRTGSKGS